VKSIRICTIGVPRFMHGGLEVGIRWAAVATFTESQRATLRDYHGRFIRVHPEDRGQLAEIGLRFETERKPLTELAPKNPAPTPPPAPKKNGDTPTPKNPAPTPPKER
jgi:hypothetical protein